MNKERYNQIIDEAYDSFGDKVDEMWQKSDVGDLDDFIYDKLLFSGYNEKGEWFARLITKEEYIYNCKTDDKFSEKWGLKIEEIELSLEERNKWAWDKWGITCEMESVLDEQEVPKRAISLMWNQRSVDTGLGLSFNVASYSLLLMMIAKQVNMVPDEVIGNLGDVHLYLNHIEPIKEQLTREPYPLPTLKHMKTDEFYKSLGEDLSLLSHLTVDDFVLENYKSHPKIYFPLSN